MAFSICVGFSGYGIVRSLSSCVPAPLNAALAAPVNTIKLYFIEVVFWLKSQITVLCPIPLNSGILELL